MPSIWVDLPEIIQSRLLALMRKVRSLCTDRRCVLTTTWQLGLAFPVHLSSDAGLLIPGLLVPPLLPDRDLDASTYNFKRILPALILLLFD